MKKIVLINIILISFFDVSISQTDFNLIEQVLKIVISKLQEFVLNAITNCFSHRAMEKEIPEDSWQG